jgi:hypothetical protein
VEVSRSPKTLRTSRDSCHEHGTERRKRRHRLRSYLQIQGRNGAGLRRCNTQNRKSKVLVSRVDGWTIQASDFVAVPRWAGRSPRRPPAGAPLVQTHAPVGILSGSPPQADRRAHLGVVVEVTTITMSLRFHR